MIDNIKKEYYDFLVWWRSVPAGVLAKSIYDEFDRSWDKMSENIHENCENYNGKKDFCLKWFEENVSERYKVCREYSEFSDEKLRKKWSN